MDPLSIVLASITLVTAIKDIVETAKAIQDSISKLPQNFKNVRQLAEEVFTASNEIYGIYVENATVFDNAKHLKGAVDYLQRRLTLVHEQCLQLSLPVNVTWIGRCRLGFYAFRNRRKIEQMILELRSDVNRCSLQFLVSEISLASLFEACKPIFNDSEQVLSNLRMEGVITQIHDRLRLLTGTITNRHLVEFTQSIPLSMTRITGDITTRDLSKAYLHQEVNIIARGLPSELCRWVQETSADLQIPLTYYFESPSGEGLRTLPKSHTALHQNTVILSYHIQSFLKMQPTSSWIIEINAAIQTLAHELCRLRMMDEAVTIATSRVTLWKTILTKDLESHTAQTRLAEAYHQLSRIFNSIGDEKQADFHRTEAIKLTDARPRNTYEIRLQQRSKFSQRRTDTEQSRDVVLRAAIEEANTLYIYPC
ncbi:hypothetical protein BDN70DRAFT_675917 [Pholiota conissans]|uniref:Fungal N-terminal domain-containing protein n=1 Tax=Pholiota conissans TaxID=109636 RepID=A0A9P5ZCX3_9AGAR|nr:hypothetical protein BDN70DRAFT_675917 [Pholiota conissans]